MSSISKDLRTKTNDELAEIVSRLKGQLLEIRFKVANGEQDKFHVIKEIRRTIAVALTILNERDVVIHFNNGAEVFRNSTIASSIGVKVEKDAEESTVEEEPAKAEKPAKAKAEKPAKEKKEEVTK